MFWLGGEPAEHNKDERSPGILSFPHQPGMIINASVWGMSVPISLVLTTTLGVVLLFAPALWQVSIRTMAAHIFDIAGAWVIVCSVISMGEVVRVVRFANWLGGLAVVLLPWLVNAGLPLSLTGTTTGILICLLSIPRGRITERYGLWQKYVR
ncbi:hypothetical protein ACQ86N_30395 [Puia sp. P3]|uniref:hypothetical protein n=1 Tax=Puia sp. P3 TaxID=3423952 RepID=UPI003D677E68